MKIILKKLKTEGVLQIGDTVQLEKLGDCTVVSILSNYSLGVKDAVGQYFNISGLSLPGVLTHKEAVC